MRFRQSRFKPRERTQKTAKAGILPVCAGQSPPLLRHVVLLILSALQISPVSIVAYRVFTRKSVCQTTQSNIYPGTASAMMRLSAVRSAPANSSNLTMPSPENHSFSSLSKSIIPADSIA